MALEAHCSAQATGGYEAWIGKEGAREGKQPVPDYGGLVNEINKTSGFRKGESKIGKSDMSIMSMNPAKGTRGCNLLHSAAAALAQHDATKTENKETPSGPAS